MDRLEHRCLAAAIGPREQIDPPKPEFRGLDVDTIAAGTGPMPKDGDVLFIEYKGKLASDGTVFDESRDIPLPVQGIFPKGTPFPIEEGATIPGFFEGLKHIPASRAALVIATNPVCALLAAYIFLKENLS
jgi:FKBP-type peptidyl-prolyl cis-trans isomerase